jgi:cell division septal protein FtsQ
MNKERGEMEKAKREKERKRQKMMRKFKGYILPNFIKTIMILIFMIFFFLNLSSTLYTNFKVTISSNLF